MAGYLSAAYCSLAYLQVVAPTTVSYNSPGLVLTVGTEMTPRIPTHDGETVTSWSVNKPLPAGISLDTSTGVITGTPTQFTAPATYFITATNAGGSAQATITAYVKDIAPVGITYPVTQATYTQGSAITTNTPTISSGINLTWSVSPSLPNGLNFSSSTGAISGTPTATTASTNYTVTATNSGGSTTAVLVLAVSMQAPLSVTYPVSTIVLTKLTASTQYTPSYTGGAPTSYSISPSLPPGMLFDSVTGQITGTPTEISAATNYTVTASNGGGSATKVLSIRVNDIAPSSLTYQRQNPTYVVGSPITQNMPGVQGGPIVTWSVSPALPAGLSLNSLTGVISGTPTTPVASTSYTVTATNSGGSTTATLYIGVTAQAPAFAVPEVYTSGTKATLTINRPGLAATSIVQSNPVFAEQSQWHRVQAVYVNNEVPLGDTNRVTGVTFRGTSDMTAKFKASAESGIYQVRNIFIVRENGERFRIRRSDLSDVEALDIEVG